MTQIARYTLTVTIERAVDTPEDAPYYIDNAAKRQLERELLIVCRRMDGDADCEVLTAELVEEGN